MTQMLNDTMKSLKYHLICLFLLFLNRLFSVPETQMVHSKIDAFLVKNDKNLTQNLTQGNVTNHLANEGSI